MAGDWLTSTWDQNAGLLASSPAAAGIERVAGAWLLDLLELPKTAAVGFVTGAMMSNFTCLAAARHEVLRRVGWDVESNGLTDAPAVTVVLGEERHDNVDLALRLLGLGPVRSVIVPADDQGRPSVSTDSLKHSRGTDPPNDRVAAGGQRSRWCVRPAGRRHRHGARPWRWVHVDGASDWATRQRSCGISRGVERADSWTTDSHKTLNVPYDSGVAIVAHPDAMYASMGIRPPT